MKMTLSEHPITPPPKLVEEWQISLDCPDGFNAKANYIAAKAARWGADQELEACCEWLRGSAATFTASAYLQCLRLSDELRAARRPKPPSLKKLALEALHSSVELCEFPREYDTIRRALEQLDD